MHLSELTHAAFVDEPLPEHHASPPSETQHAIGKLLAEIIPDGATLQVVIGGIPELAHPAFRDGLMEAAYNMNLLPVRAPSRSLRHHRAIHQAGTR